GDQAYAVGAHLGEPTGGRAGALGGEHDREQASDVAPEVVTGQQRAVQAGGTHLERVGGLPHHVGAVQLGGGGARGLGDRVEAERLDAAGGVLGRAPGDVAGEEDADQAAPSGRLHRAVVDDDAAAGERLGDLAADRLGTCPGVH